MAQAFRRGLVRLFATLMVGAIVAAGALRLSLWTVPLFALIIALAFSAQKLPLWRKAFASESRGRVAAKIALTLLVQAGFAALFYGSAFVIASAAGDEDFSLPSALFGAREMAALAACAASGVVAFLLRPTQAGPNRSDG